MAHIALHSPHPPVAVAERMKAAVGDTLSADTPKRVTGNGSEQSMILWVHRPHLRNDFKVMLDAELTAERGGTRIEGRLGTARGVSMFMALWLGFVGLFLIVALAIGIFARPPLAFILPFTGIPLLMFLFGIALFTLARKGNASDGAAILKFLQDTVDARPISDDAR